MHRRRKVDEKSCATFLLVQPWLVHPTDLLSRVNGKNTHTHTHIDLNRANMRGPYLQSQYVLDVFFSVSGGKLFDPDSGIREGIGCEVGELES